MLVILENYQISFNFSLIIKTLHRTKTIYFSCALHLMHCLNMHSCILFPKNYESCNSRALLIICFCINNFLLTGMTLHFPHIKYQFIRNMKHKREVDNLFIFRKKCYLLTCFLAKRSFHVCYVLLSTYKTETITGRFTEKLEFLTVN